MALVDSIIGAESGGDPYATNPNSTASGLGQFTDSTWLQMLRQHRPDLANRYNTQELLSLKADPSLSRDMTSAYAGDNAAYLRSKGLDTSPGAVYLAHFAGPGGAQSVLSADDNSPVRDVLSPAAMQANPFLRNMTVGELKQWASNKVGGSPQGQGGFDQFQPYSAQPQVATAATAPAATPPISEPSSTSTPQGAFAALGQVPALISQFEKQDSAPVPQLHINYPVPPGLLRARMLAQAMAMQPISGEKTL